MKFRKVFFPQTVMLNDSDGDDQGTGEKPTFPDHDQYNPGRFRKRFHEKVQKKTPQLTHTNCVTPGQFCEPQTRQLQNAGNDSDRLMNSMKRCRENAEHRARHTGSLQLVSPSSPL